MDPMGYEMEGPKFVAIPRSTMYSYHTCGRSIHFFGGFCCVHFWLLGVWYLSSYGNCGIFLLLEGCESQQGGLPKTFGVCDMIS